MRTRQKLYRYRIIGAQTIGIKVLQAGNGGHLGRDGLGSQPAAARGGRAVNQNLLVLKVAVVAVKTAVLLPVANLTLDRRLGGGLQYRFNRGVRLRHSGRFTTAELLAQSPERRICEVEYRKCKLAASASIFIELVGAHVAHQRNILHHVNSEIALLLVAHNHGVELARLGRIGKLQGQFRLE